MALTKQQELSGFGQKLYTIDDLIKLSDGRFLRKYDEHLKLHYFLYLKFDNRYLTQFISKDKITYTVKNKIERHRITNKYNVCSKLVNDIINEVNI